MFTAWPDGIVRQPFFGSTLLHAELRQMSLPNTLLQTRLMLYLVMRCW